MTDKSHTQIVIKEPKKKIEKSGPGPNGDFLNFIAQLPDESYETYMKRRYGAISDDTQAEELKFRRIGGTGIAYSNPQTGRPLRRKPLYATSNHEKQRYSKDDYDRDLKAGAKALAGGSLLSFMAALGYYALPAVVAPILLK